MACFAKQTDCPDKTPWNLGAWNPFAKLPCWLDPAGGRATHPMQPMALRFGQTISDDGGLSGHSRVGEYLLCGAGFVSYFRP